LALVRVQGASPTRAAISFPLKRPSSGSSPSSVAAVTGPVPFSARRQAAASANAGGAATWLAIAPSMASTASARLAVSVVRLSSTHSPCAVAAFGLERGDQLPASRHHLDQHRIAIDRCQSAP
jgi:hypothetical protein